MIKKDFGEEISLIFEHHMKKYCLIAKKPFADSIKFTLICTTNLKRWNAEYSAPFITALTKCAGSVKTFSIFWQMILLTFNRNPEFSFFIHRGISKVNGNSRMFFIISQKTSFSIVHFPLPLQPDPFSPNELRFILIKLNKENLSLKMQRQRNQAAEKIQELKFEVKSLTKSILNCKIQQELKKREQKKKFKDIRKIISNRSISETKNTSTELGSSLFSTSFCISKKNSISPSHRSNVHKPPNSPIHLSGLELDKIERYPQQKND